MNRSVFAILLAALLIATPAVADVYWSSIATGCVPNSTAIQGDLYTNPNDALVTPSGSNIKPIVLVCPVQPNSAGSLPNTLSMTYLDSSGAVATAFVKAQLVRVNRNTGAAAVLVTASSDDNAGMTTRKIEAAFSSPLNFESFYYHVRITLDRANANQVVRSIGVALELITN